MSVLFAEQCCYVDVLSVHVQENEGNVFLIEPYHYFKCTAEINNAAGKGVGGGDDSGTGADDDNHLSHARSVLKVRMETLSSVLIHPCVRIVVAKMVIYG